MSTLQRILCCTDFSETARRAFDAADDLAGQTGAELMVLYVFDLAHSFEASHGLHPGDPDVTRQLLELQTSRGARIRTLQRAGEPAQVICWTAHEQQCQLVVVGTHGRAGWKKLVFGSVAHKVLHHAPCPVMMVRHGVEEGVPVERPVVCYPVAGSD